jgi:transposase
MRLFNNIVNQERKSCTGDKRKNPSRKLLLKRSADVDPHVRRAINRWLDENPTVREVYQYKEAMHRFYRIKGMKHAKRVLIKLTDQMALSNIPEIKTLRKTIHQWRNESKSSTCPAGLGNFF